MTNKIFRVLHPITRLIIGGAQENTLFTAELLDKKKFLVEVVAGPQTGSEGSLIEEAYQRGINLSIIPHLVREINLLHDFRAFSELSLYMRKNMYSIVHTHSSKAGILGRLAAKKMGVPIIIHTIHGWSFHEKMPVINRIVFIALEKIIASFTDALIAVSKKDIQKGLDKGIGKENQYHLIRSAIPLEIFSPDLYNKNEIRRELGLPLDRPIIGNIGRFSYQKNPLEWISVAERISAKLPDCHFLLIGDGPLKDKVILEAQKAGIINKMSFLGLRRDVPKMLAVMDVFLLTSLWEGLPRVIPEAFAMGVPVVANSIDGVSEIIQNNINGFLSKPGDIDSKANACLSLVNDPDLKSSISAAGIKLVKEEFSLSKMIMQITQLYESLISLKTKPRES